MTGRNYAAPCAVPWQSVGLLRASYHKEQCWAPRTDSIKVIFWCQINPGTLEPARPAMAFFGKWYIFFFNRHLSKILTLWFAGLLWPWKALCCTPSTSRDRRLNNRLQKNGDWWTWKKNILKNIFCQLIGLYCNSISNDTVTYTIIYFPTLQISC